MRIPSPDALIIEPTLELREANARFSAVLQSGNMPEMKALMFLRKQKAAHLINTGSIQPFGTDKAVPFAYKFKSRDFNRSRLFLFIQFLLFQAPGESRQ
jgi:hypothetical protein